MKYEVTNCRNGEVVMVINAGDDNPFVSPDYMKIELANDVILTFPHTVNIKEKPLPDTYIKSFVIDIGDLLTDEVAESLMDLGVEHNEAYRIASSVDCTNVNIDVEVCAEDGDCAVESVDTY